MYQLFISAFEYILEPPPPWPNAAPCTCAQDGYSRRYAIEKHKSGHARPRRAGIVVRHRTSPSFFLVLWSCLFYLCCCTRAYLTKSLVRLDKPQMDDLVTLDRPQTDDTCVEHKHHLSEPQQAAIDENKKCWNCISEFDNESVPWTHAKPLPPPEPPPDLDLTFEQVIPFTQSLWESLVDDFVSHMIQVK